MTYYECTTIDQGYPWCSLTPVYSGLGIPCEDDGKRGIIYTTGGNGQGKPCVFPFEYGGKTHRTCIYDDHSQPWCATSSDATYWGECLGEDAFIFTGNELWSKILSHKLA